MRLAGLLAALACLSAPPSHADELGSELKRFLHDDAEAVLHFRSYFLDRTNPAPPNNAAWAGGGWVGLKTGWLYDTFQLAAVGYTTQPLWAPLTTDGTQLLAPGQYGFWTLGEMNASIRAKNQVFTAYRTPAQFEAWHRATRLPGVGDAALAKGSAPPTPDLPLDPKHGQAQAMD